MLEDERAVQTIMLEFVGGPVVAVAHPAQGVELQAGIDVHIVEIDGGLQRHFVARQLVLVVDHAKTRVFHKQVHGRPERKQRPLLLEHPGEHGLAGEIERTRNGIEFGPAVAHALGSPTNGLVKLAVGVDEFLQRPIQRARRRGGHHLGQEFVGQRRSVTHGAVAVEEGVVENPVDALEAGFHAEVAAKALEPFDGERVAVRQQRETVGGHGGDHAKSMLHIGTSHRIQYGIGEFANEFGDFSSSRQLVGDGGRTLPVLRVTLIEACRLARHAREGVLVHLGGVGRHMRDAAGGETGDDAGREQGQCGQGQEAAVALAHRHPLAATEFGQAQMFEVTHDGIGKELLQIVGLGSGACHGIIVVRGGDADHGMRVHSRGTTGAPLVGQDHPEVPDGLLDPSVGGRAVEARAGAAGTALQEDQQGKVVMHVFGRGNHAIEQFDGFPVECPSGLVAGPVERNIDGMVLYGQSGHVVFAQHCHGSRL